MRTAAGARSRSAAPGPVRTRDLVVVMDTGAGPEMCLGAVAESYPPQCSGPAIEGWSWRDQQAFEKVGDVRWGYFALTGDVGRYYLHRLRRDPGRALQPRCVEDEQDPPPPLRQRDEASINEIAREVERAAGRRPAPTSRTTRSWSRSSTTTARCSSASTRQYGANAVRVVSQLVDAG